MSVVSMPVKSMLLASLLMPAISVRQVMDTADVAESTGNSRGPGSVCCCRINTKGPQKCSGNARNGARKYFYPAATPLINKDAAPGSHTCYDKPLCCHTFEGSCQTDVFGFVEGRYSITNVAHELCTALPEVAESLFTATPEEIFSNGTEEKPAFLGAVDNGGKEGLMKRDFTIMVDRSGSMSEKDLVTIEEKLAMRLGVKAGKQYLSRWKQVEMAVEFLAPKVVEQDPDGVSVVMFDNGFDSHENVKTVTEIANLFKVTSPGGATYLAEPLKEVMEPDTIGRAETIFVLTDGAASDPRDVARVISERTKQICRPELLSISFIQVGDDARAAKYLEQLDDGIAGAKFDIVDAMSMQEMHGKSFLDIVEKSITD